MWANNETDWGTLAKAFHWLIALAIFVQFGLGWVAEDMPASRDKFDLFVWHKSIGITVLLLVALRLAWRAHSRPPAALATGREALLAKLGHWLLYVLMFAVPLSGWWISDTSRIPFRIFGQVPAPDLLDANREASELAESVHGVLTTLLLVLVVIHILAALRHHFLLRDRTLTRLLPLVRPRGD